MSQKFLPRLTQRKDLLENFDTKSKSRSRSSEALLRPFNDEDELEELDFEIE